MHAVILYVIGIPFVAGVRNLAALYYAYKDSKTPMYASFVAVVINVILNLSLMYVIGFRAFPLATTLSSLANMAILLYFLRRKAMNVPVGALFSFYIQLAIASCIGGAAGLGASHLMTTYVGTSFIIQILSVLVSGLLALVVFYGGCRIIGVQDAKTYLKRLIKK
jgi:putative peptidoglycan lipid II flippase